MNREPVQTVNKYSPSLWKELDPQIQDANRTPNYFNPKRSSTRHIILKLSKLNDRNISQSSQGKEEICRFKVFTFFSAMFDVLIGKHKMVKKNFY